MNRKLYPSKLHWYILGVIAYTQIKRGKNVCTINKMIAYGCERAVLTRLSLPYEGSEITVSPLRNGCGGRLRSCDLLVMSQTSYQTAPPRHIEKKALLSYFNCNKFLNI